MTSADYFERTRVAFHLRHSRIFLISRRQFPILMMRVTDAFLIGENEIASICSAPLAIFIV
jgi:hypothetical protein